MKVKFSDETEFIKLCISYRVTSVLLSTAVYLILSERSAVHLAVAGGMLAACGVGTYLYYRLFSQDNHERLLAAVFIIEMTAYGGFIFLSGGFFSPYLWYLVGCLFILSALQQYQRLTLLALAWCLVCAALSRPALDSGQVFWAAKINLCLGVLIVMGGVFILSAYVRRLAKNQEMQQLLSAKLLAEKQRSEQALEQLMEMYATADLLAITDRELVMEKLTKLLSRTVWPKGCLLLKVSMEGEIELQGSDKLSALAVQELLAQLTPLRSLQKRQETGEIAADQMTFAVRVIHTGTLIQGILAAPCAAKSGADAQGQQIEAFYLQMIEVIFRSMDVQRGLEQYIISEEQNRIANEIHDTVIQKLFGMVCALRVLKESLGELDGAEIGRQLGAVEKSAESTMQELREAIYGLRFAKEDGEDFIHRLEDYMAEVSALHGVQIDLDIASCAQPMSALEKTILYRIACEAVNNAVRHGRAEHIKVIITVGEADIRARISDDGAGFAPAECERAGSGLKNMYQQVALLKGRFDIHSDAEGGTAIRFVLPR